MFGIGGSEVIIIAFVVLLLFGPDKLPQMARTFGRFMREFKRYQAMMESTFKAEMYLSEQNAMTERAEKAKKAVDGAEPGDATEAEDAPVSENADADPYAKARAYREMTGVVAPGETPPEEAPEAIDPSEDSENASIAPEHAGWVPGSPAAPGMTSDDDGEEAGEQQ